MVRNPFVVACIVCLWMVVSCGGLPTDPTSSQLAKDSPNPALMASENPGTNSSNRYLWGYWNVRWDPDTHDIEAVPVRDGVIHLNILKFLEETMCQTCLVFGDNDFNEDGDLEIEIGLIHPAEDGVYDADVFAGFDVRGVVIFGGTYYFDEHGLLISSYDKDEYTIVNADGYTTLWSPAAFEPDWFGRAIFEYFPGKYEMNGVDLTTTLNPYMAFYTLTERRTFEAYDHDEQIYTIRFPEEIVPLEFGYAVDASWAKPSNLVNPDVPDDFPPQANSIEAYRITAAFDGSLTPLGGESLVVIKVYDWQGGDTIESVKLEAPDLFNGIIEAGFTMEHPLYSEYVATINNELGAGLGSYPLLVSVQDTSTVPIVGDVDAHQIFTVDVYPPLDLIETVMLDNYPIEGNFDQTTTTCFFAPVPAIDEYPIMGIDEYFDQVFGFPSVLTTGGIGLSRIAREIYLATDQGFNTWTNDVSVYDIDDKNLKHTIDIPPLVPGNNATMPLDFVVFENAQEVWVSLNLEDQVGMFHTGTPSPDITRIDTGNNPTTLMIDESDYRVFVACDGNDIVTIINGYSKEVIGTIDLDTPMESPDPALPATMGMAYVPDSGYFYIATLLYGAIDYYDLSDNSYVGSIQLVPEGTEIIVGLIYDPATGLLFATGGHVVPNQGYLWAIDPETNEVIYEAETSAGNPSFPGLNSTDHLVFVPDPAGLVDIFEIVM